MKDFEKQLSKNQISVLFRENELGRIYGVTFIDHRQKFVFNGSRLGKEFSANVFQQKFNENGHNPQQEKLPEFVPPQSNSIPESTFENLSRLFAIDSGGENSRRGSLHPKNEKKETKKTKTISYAKRRRRKELSKIIELIRGVSILVLIIHIYWFCYEFLVEVNATVAIIDRILLNFQKYTGLFSKPIWTKLVSFGLLAISCLGIRGIKAEKITWGKISAFLILGLTLFFFNGFIIKLHYPLILKCSVYMLSLAAGYIFLLKAGLWMSRLIKHNLMEDVFNMENESFMQEIRLMENEYSVNLPTRFEHKGKTYNGWINVVNPFRASIVLGTPGSGKSYAIINNYIKQQIRKGFGMYIYDIKFDDLSIIAYNTLMKNIDKYEHPPKFYVINFDNPERSHRCNPIAPEFMTDIADAYESAYTIMLNLNKTWIQKQGDFFVESPIILLTAIIWYLKIYKNGKYCTFPHAIEFLNKKYADIFTILTSYRELENYLSPFIDAWEGGAQDQLQGQIASAKIPLSRMISPQLILGYVRQRFYFGYQ